MNFYGFRKIQTKPIRNEDFDKSTAKHVTFYNDKFKRGRQDLLKDIQRSTRGGGNNASLADQAKEIDSLRATVAELERRILDMEHRWQDMAVRLDREIQTKTELVVMELMGGRQTSLSQVPSLGEAALLQRAERSFGAAPGRNINGAGGVWGAPLLGSQAARAFSTASASSMGNHGTSHGAGTVTSADPSSMVGATLPPHPKQKSTLPPPPAAAPDIGGFIQAPNHGGINPGASYAGSFALRNAWEDKFFSTLMMQDGASRAASLAGLGNNMSGLAALAAAQQQQAAVALRHASIGNGPRSTSIGNAAPGAKPGHFIGRQSTADILLEAAGEVNKKSEASERNQYRQV